MKKEEISAALRKAFPHRPTEGQDELLDKVSEFLRQTNGRDLFLLKGYAGTGKTSSIAALVKTIPLLKMKCILLAPTGRAAKVMTAYTGNPAFTIHKKIYKRAGEGENYGFILQKNTFSDMLFIVDEASMISGSSNEISGGNSLLEDLLRFIYSGNNCRLIFVGDTAQLPPVGSELSPALDEKFLIRNYRLNIISHELTEVVRQEADSGILFNATMLREMIRKGESGYPKFEPGGFPDIIRIDGMELEDALNTAHSRYGAGDCIVICRSNKRANIFNAQIRARIRWQEEEISAGDLMMVVKNNYSWLPEGSEAGFIANGDITQIAKIIRREEKFGFRFADVWLRMIDYPDEKEIEVKLLLNTIMSDGPSLNKEDSRRLYMEVNNSYLHIENRQLRFLKVKDDPYFNALQVKFAYAVTCHKSQGGQWGSVFVEQGYLTREMINVEYLRWLYTAVSRASEKLYLVNFPDDFFA